MADNNGDNAEKTLNNLPKHLLQDIYENIGPGDPERLRSVCRQFDTLYREIEGQIPREPIRNALVELISQGQGITVLYRGSRNDWRLDNANPQQIMKFLRLAGSLRVEIAHDQLFFPDNGVRRTIKNILQQRGRYWDVNIVPWFLAPAVEIITLFPENGPLSLFPQAKELVNMDLELLRRFRAIHCIHTCVIPSVDVHRILSNHMNLRAFYATVTEEMDFDRYLEEWKNNARVIMEWQVTFPKVQPQPVVPPISIVQRPGAALKVYRYTSSNRQITTRITLI